MNIVFYHNNGIIPTSGGISRITDTLRLLFSNKGHRVWFLGAKKMNLEYDYYEYQQFLPSSDLFSQDNVLFVRNFIKDNSIDFIINQDALNPESSLFLKLCKSESNQYKIISCIHNSVLTPIYHAAYQKEYILKKRGMSFLFNICKTQIVSHLLVWVYIRKYRQRYLSTLKNSDGVFVLNEGQNKELLEMCGIISSSKIHVIPNCVDIPESTSTNKENLILWVGNFDYSIKRPDYMLLIWKAIETSCPNWKLMMLGDGCSLEEMKQLAKRLQLTNVEFMGRVNPEKFYKKAQVSCVTSIHESFSLVTAESMMNGVVPIVFDSFTSAPLLIDNGVNGILIPHFNLNKYSEELTRLIEDDHLRANLKEAALNSVKRFSFENIYSLWIKELHAIKEE